MSLGIAPAKTHFEKERIIPQAKSNSPTVRAIKYHPAYR